MKALAAFCFDAKTILHLDGSTLGDSILRNQHHSQACLALDHSSISISGPFERKCLDHRADIFQDAEHEGVLGINRYDGQVPVDRASSKDGRERIQLDLVLAQFSRWNVSVGIPQLTAR